MLVDLHEEKRLRALARVQSSIAEMREVAGRLSSGSPHRPLIEALIQTLVIQAARLSSPTRDGKRHSA